MSFLQRLLRPRRMTDEDRERQFSKLDGRRKSLRAKISEDSTRIRRAWTQFRTWQGDAAGKKRIKQEIKELEARRKQHVKEMLKVQSEMKKLGVQAAAGAVDTS